MADNTINISKTNDNEWRKEWDLKKMKKLAEEAKVIIIKRENQDKKRELDELYDS